MDTLNVIPKTIHYCWFGKGAIPANLQQCLDTWAQIMPDYTIKRWSEENFDIDSVVFTKQAHAAKKWAFVSDYVRLYALYTEGGIYMDTDVFVYKPFNEFLKHDFFSAVEYHEDIFLNGGIHQIQDDGTPLEPKVYINGMGVLVALMGAAKGNPFIKTLLDFYDNTNFVKKDGTLCTDVIQPAIIAKELEKYGFKYKNELQLLPGNMVLYPDSVFVGSRFRLTPSAYALHYVTGSWGDTFGQRIIKKIKRLFR